jgi:chitinase
MGRKAYWVSLRQPGRRNTKKVIGPRLFSRIHKKPGCVENTARFFCFQGSRRETMRSNITKESGNSQGNTSRVLLIMMLSWILSLAGHTSCFATTVLLQWDAETDPGLVGYKVYYQADSSAQPFSGTGATQGVAPVNVLNQTSTTISGLDPSHSYYFAVTAYDNSGVESSYSNIVYVPELVSPTTSITSPANNSTVNGIVSVTASGSDNVGVTKVEFYVNGALVATDTATPYVYSWNTSALATGLYVLMTKAYDAAGNIGQSGNVTVTVVNDSVAPVVSLTAPGNGSTVNGTVTITASASDNVGVSNVEFYLNGTLLFASNVSPYTYNLNTTSLINGSYTLIAKAYDNAGNIGQTSAISVTVLNDITAPTVNIGVRKAGSGGSGVLAVTATASDDVGVSKVEFYVNGSLASTATSAPYVYSWDSAAVSSGYYTLIAKAYDAAGNIGQSGTVKLSKPNVQFR